MDNSAPWCWSLTWSLVGIQIYNYEEKSPPDTGQIWNQLARDKESSAFAGTVKQKFPSQMPICTLRGGMLSPRDRNVFHKFPGVREWVCDSWTESMVSRRSANYHHPPLTIPTSGFLKSVSGTFVILSLCIRLQLSAACHFVLHVIMLSGIRPDVMENDVVIVGFNSSGFFQHYLSRCVISLWQSWVFSACCITAE